MSDFFGALVDGAFQIGGQTLGQYYNKKNMRDQARIQYQYAQRYAENSPSWNVRGLREAGLNPILAVSNGVNFGANIPNISNSSPDGKINTKFTEAVGRMYDRDVNKYNAESSRISADSSATQASASLMQGQAALSRAESQNKVDAANIALKTIEAEKLKGSKFDTGIMRDAEKVINSVIDSACELFNPSNYGSLDTYLNNKPSNPGETRTDYQMRIKRDTSKGAHSRYINPYWKSSKSRDGSPVYRRRGDVGGVVHMYR